MGSMLMIKEFGIDISNPNEISDNTADMDFVITLDVNNSDKVFITMYQKSHTYDAKPLKKEFIDFRNFVKNCLKEYIELPKNKFKSNDSDIGYFDKNKIVDYMDWINKVHIYYNEFSKLKYKTCFSENSIC